MSVVGAKASEIGGGAPRSSQTDEVLGRAERLDGYRAVAVVLYALFLAYELTRAGSGAYAHEGTPLDVILRSLQLPSVFFVLTGLLAFLPFVQAALEPRAGALPWYHFSRRVLLVLPQYLLAVVIVWVWRFDPTFDRWHDPLRHLSLTHIFSKESIFWPIGPSWVVATELWFFALIALLGAGLLRRCKQLSYPSRRSLLIAVATALLLVGVGYKSWAHFIAEIPRDNSPVYLSPLANLDSLALGMLLAISFVDARYRPRFGRRAAFLLSTISLVGMAALIWLRWQNPITNLYFHSLFALAFSLLLATTILGPHPLRPGRASSWRPLRGLGAISFAVLLFQEPLLSELAARGFLVRLDAGRLLFNAGVVLTLSILMATAVYWLFVYPAMQVSYLFTPEASRTGRYPVKELGEQAYVAPSVEQRASASVTPPIVLEDVTPVPAVPPNASTASTRVEGLDGYRAVAALLLVVYHAYQFTREGLGLETYAYEGTTLDLVLRSLQLSGVFFVLSGFLIFLPFARAAVEQRGERSLKNFFIRRAMQILPQYYLAIILVWTWRYAGLPGQWNDLFLHLSFAHIFSREYIFWTIGPSWAVAVEVWFYIFIAFLGFLAYRLCKQLDQPARLVLLTVTTLGLLAVSVLFKYWAFAIAQIPATNYPIYYGPLARLDTFACGMLLALAFIAARYQPLFGRGVSYLLRLLSLAAAIGLFIYRWQSPMVDLYFHTLFALAFVLLLASTVLGPRGSLLERFMNWRPLQFITLISYSIYLWHEPIMIELAKYNFLVRPQPEAFATNTLILLVLSILAGTVVYWMVQYPIMYLRYLFTSQGLLANRYPDENTDRL